MTISEKWMRLEFKKECVHTQTLFHAPLQDKHRTRNV